MGTVGDASTFGRTRLSFADEAEIDEFVATLARFERGELAPDEWRRYRLVRGTYGQRQAADAQMLRAKIPQGLLDGEGLRALADVAEDYSRGFAHVTTRQNVQFHFVRLHHVEPAMRRLAAAGLTTREACGNSVRNVTACPYAGVADDEAFDVTPYAEALTRLFLRHPLSSSLPRKFKIAFEGCGDDHVALGINDVGFRARVVEGVRGFRVTVAGSTSILPVSGLLLFDFLPAGRICDVVEAILRVYHRLGDYEHRQRNRLKFLIRAIGWDAWRARFDEALADVRRDGGVALPFDPEAPPAEEPPRGPRPEPPDARLLARLASAGTVAGPGIVPGSVRLGVISDAFARWSATNVRRQRQRGFAIVTVRLPLGDITAGQLRALAAIADAHGDGTVRFTVAQNLLLRWVPQEDLERVYRALTAAGLDAPDADTLADVVSCPGAESCRLAVTQSRGLGRLLSEHLSLRPEAVDAAGGDIKISGCPNGCGQHHVAAIGFQGSVRKVGGRAVPQYFVSVGGGVTASGAHFGKVVAKIPVRRLPEAVDRLVALYRSERDGNEALDAFFRRIPSESATKALEDLARFSADDALPEDYVDLGEEAAFAPEVLDGECSA